jgi:pSer/pThr/pTyr-binding forkhead associated (FHA) protein
MASLRLTFPEKDQPTVIALTGARLTIGRLPFNTIQIIDRTVSGFHAELINEHGHYRLHDRGSSNGTYVNGQRVSDFHLNEACTIGFGTVEAHFSPEDVGANEEAETFPSRGEVNAVRQENVEMRATVSALREEIEALRSAPDSKGAGTGETVAREEYEKLVMEREVLKEAKVRNEEEIARLKADLAILKRDRLNLQLAYDSSQRELEQTRRKLNGVDEEPALPPVEAAAVLAAQADEVRIDVPKPAPAPVPVTAEDELLAAAETPAPETAEPATIPAAAEDRPAATLAPAPPPPGKFSKPGLPVNVPRKPTPVAPKVPESVVSRAPMDSGVRAVARPPIAPGRAGAPADGAGAKPNAGGTVQTTKLQRPLPPPRQIQIPTKKLSPVQAPTAGPKGTQKLTE